MTPSDSYRNIPSWNGGQYSLPLHVPQTAYHPQNPQLPPSGFNAPGYPGSYMFPAPMPPPPLHYNYPNARANPGHMVLERCSANDDILISALLEAEKVGSLCSQAIEGIAVCLSSSFCTATLTQPVWCDDMVSQANGHGGSSSWFAYYVDRRQYFDEKVAVTFDRYLENEWAKTPESRSQSTSKVKRVGLPVRPKCANDS